MTLMQRALFLAAAFGVSWSQEPAFESQLTRLVERVDMLVHTLQYQDDSLRESIQLLQVLVAENGRQNKTLNDITEAVIAVGTQLDRMDEEVLSRLNTLNSEVVSLRPTPPPVWSLRQIGDAPLRLIGRTTPVGRLEVFKAGQWGTVCDDHFSDAMAAGFCRIMGLPSASATFVERFGGGSGPIHLDGLSCDGADASDVRYCHHAGWGIHDCTHDEDVGLRCN